MEDNSCSSAIASDICCKTSIVSVDVPLIGTCDSDELSCTGV